MSTPRYAPGTITVVLRDGRRFVYREDEEPATIIADLVARGVRDGEIGNTIHVIRAGALDGVRRLARHRDAIAEESES